MKNEFFISIYNFEKIINKYDKNHNRRFTEKF